MKENTTTLLNGKWFVGKDQLLETIFGDKIDENLMYKTKKIVPSNDEYHIYTLAMGVPSLSVYKKEQLSISNPDELIITGNPVFTDYYNIFREEEESKEAFTENFIKDWQLTKDELKQYLNPKEKEALPLIKITVKNTVNKSIPEHPLLRAAKEGIWAKEENIAGKVFFKGDKAFPERLIHLKLNDEELELTTVGEEIVKRTYVTDSVSITIENDHIRLIQRGPIEAETTIKKSGINLPKETNGLPFFQIG